jgi:hypothetical protein
MEKYRTSHAGVLQDLISLLPEPLGLRFVALFEDILADLRLLLAIQVLVFLQYELAQPIAATLLFRFLTRLRAITLELDTKQLVLISLIETSLPGSESILGVGLGLLHFCRQRRDVSQDKVCDVALTKSSVD